MVKEILYQKLDEAEVIEGSRVQELMDDEEAHFSLHTAYKAEIFTGKRYTIYFTNLTDSELPDALEWLKEGASELNAITLDLEWKPFQPTKPIALFQMATKDRCLVVKNDADPNETNRNTFVQFMITNKFIAKGADIDVQKLYRFFNVNFEPKIIDIHNYLQKTYTWLNFVKMYETLVDTPPTASFKDKEVSISNWESDVYTNKQFFYSSFDAIALYESFITAYPTNPSLFITYDVMKQGIKKNQKKKQHNQPGRKKKQDNQPERKVSQDNQPERKVSQDNQPERKVTQDNQPGRKVTQDNQPGRRKKQHNQPGRKKKQDNQPERKVTQGNQPGRRKKQHNQTQGEPSEIPLSQFVIF